MSVSGRSQDGTKDRAMIATVRSHAAMRAIFMIQDFIQESLEQVVTVINHLIRGIAIIRQAGLERDKVSCVQRHCAPPRSGSTKAGSISPMACSMKCFPAGVAD